MARPSFAEVDWYSTVGADAEVAGAVALALLDVRAAIAEILVVVVGVVVGVEVEVVVVVVAEMKVSALGPAFAGPVRAATSGLAHPSMSFATA